MAKDVEYNVTSNDKSGSGLASAERRFAASQERIRKISEDNQRKIQSDSDRYAAKIGRTLETVIGRSAPKISMALGDAFAQGASAGGPILAAGIAAAAPLIGATLSAAVIGGVGAGGVIGGVLLAARDPRVKAAGTQLGQSLLANLQQDAAPFVEPVLDSIKRISAEADSLRGRIQSIFANSAQFLPGLTTGTLRGVDAIVAGIDKIIAKAGPVMSQVGSSIGQIGDHLGQALETISGGSEESAEALKDLTNGLTFLVDASAGAVRALTEVYGFLNRIGAASGAFGPFLDLIGKTGGEAEQAASQTARMAAATAATGTAASSAAGPIGSFTDKVNALTQAGRSLYDSTTQVGEATDSLKKSLRENGKTLDENTTKGRANRQALSGLAGALIAQYNATVQVNGEGLKSNAVAASNRAAFIKLATAFTGSKDKAAALATQMGLIPAKKSTDFKANTHDAQAEINALKDKINSIHGKTVSVNVVVAQSQLRRVENTLNRLGSGAFAAGPSWAAVDSNSGVSRTGGPAPVNVNNNVAVSLDGAPFYQMTTRAVRAQSERDAWRTKVGAR